VDFVAALSGGAGRPRQPARPENAGQAAREACAGRH
jgi:hypothetical protein